AAQRVTDRQTIKKDLLGLGPASKILTPFARNSQQATINCMGACAHPSQPHTQPTNRMGKASGCHARSIAPHSIAAFMPLGKGWETSGCGSLFCKRALFGSDNDRPPPRVIGSRPVRA